MPLSRPAEHGIEVKNQVLMIMNELRKTNSLIHKNDIFNATRGKMSVDDLDKALN